MSMFTNGLPVCSQRSYECVHKRVMSVFTNGLPVCSQTSYECLHKRVTSMFMNELRVCSQTSYEYVHSELYSGMALLASWLLLPTTKQQFHLPPAPPPPPPHTHTSFISLPHPAPFTLPPAPIPCYSLPHCSPVYPRYHIIFELVELLCINFVRTQSLVLTALIFLSHCSFTSLPALSVLRPTLTRILLKLSATLQPQISWFSFFRSLLDRSS